MTEPSLYPSLYQQGLGRLSYVLYSVHVELLSRFVRLVEFYRALDSWYSGLLSTTICFDTIDHS